MKPYLEGILDEGEECICGGSRGPYDPGPHPDCPQHGGPDEDGVNPYEDKLK